MAKVNHSFVISKFTNPSGDIVFRVAGQIAGKRVRKNLPTSEEAEAERSVLELQKLQVETDIGARAAITRLSDNQLHEAESVFRRLLGSPLTLTFCVEFAVSNYRAPERQKSLADAILEYVAAKEHEFAQ